MRRYVTASGAHVGRRAHHVDDQRREREPEHGEHEAEADREPAAVDADLGGVPAVPGAELAGDAPRSSSRRGS